MIKLTLLEKVQAVLCCPDGICRAKEAGDPKACCAARTRDYAQAAIDLCKEEFAPKVPETTH